MFVEMKVSGLTIDPLTNTPIVILKDLEGKRAVPIWIGLFEASAIATELEKISFSRPMTHDLIRDLLKILEAKVMKIEIVDLRNNTFFACIHLKRNGDTLIVDSRPSDAIALALRTGASVQVADEVLAEAAVPVEPEGPVEDEDEAMERFREFLDSVNPQDFQ